MLCGLVGECSSQGRLARIWRRLEGAPRWLSVADGDLDFGDWPVIPEVHHHQRAREHQPLGGLSLALVQARRVPFAAQLVFPVDPV